jgi:hypothetical protein
MSRLLTQAVILDRYGPRLTMDQLAEALGIKTGSLRNLVAAGTCPVATYLDVGRRWADYQAVAQHIDDCASRASREATAA